MLQTYVDIVVSGRGHICHCSTGKRGQHDAMFDQDVLWHNAVDVTSCDVAAHLADKKKKKNFSSCRLDQTKFLLPFTLNP